MQLELYLAESRVLAAKQVAILDQAADMLARGEALNPLEENGVLHALQLLAENAIGKAKHLIKAENQPVPVSAYDAFSALARMNRIDKDELKKWHAIVGLRNRLVHDYMNLDMALVLNLIEQRYYYFVRDFLYE